MNVLEKTKYILMIGTFALLSAACESEEKIDTIQESNSTSGLSVDLPLNVINISSFENYDISGECRPELGPVDIFFSDVSHVTECNSDSRFSATLNLQTLSIQELKEILIRQGGFEYKISEEALPQTDLIAILDAPTIEGQEFAISHEHKVDFYCSERGEKVSFQGKGLAPSVQTHECSSSEDKQSIVLTLDLNMETKDLNLISVVSVDSSQNITTIGTTFNLPIDNKTPEVTITSTGDIQVGQIANFIVEIEDENLDFSNLDFLPSSGWVSSPKCEAFPCSVSVSGADEGFLRLTVESGAVKDLAGNSNQDLVMEEITVNPPANLASSN